MIYLYSPEGDASGGGGSTLLQSDGAASQQNQQAETTTQTAANDTTQTQQQAPNIPDFIVEKFRTAPNPLEAQAQAYVDAQKLIGQRQTVKPPGADAKPEEIQAWRQLIGVPETPDAYGLKAPEKLPDGVEWNDDQAKEFSGLAHELGLTPAQVQKLAEYDVQRQAKFGEKNQARLTEFIGQQRDALKKEWGENYENNVSRALRAAELLGIDSGNPEIGNSPAMIKALEKMSKLMTEDKFVGADKVGQGLTNSDTVRDIQTNPNNPWYKAYRGDEGKSRQEEAVRLINSLRGIKS